MKFYEKQIKKKEGNEEIKGEKKWEKNKNKGRKKKILWMCLFWHIDTIWVI